MKEEEYMRVGTTLYKVVNQPCASGGYEKRRVIWNNRGIVEAVFADGGMGLIHG